MQSTTTDMLTLEQVPLGWGERGIWSLRMCTTWMDVCVDVLRRLGVCLGWIGASWENIHVTTESGAFHVVDGDGSDIIWDWGKTGVVEMDKQKVPGAKQRWGYQACLMPRKNDGGDCFQNVPTGFYWDAGNKVSARMGFFFSFLVWSA